LRAPGCTTWSAERRQPCFLGPAPAFLGPPCDLAGVGTGRHAEAGGGFGPRFVQSALVEAEQDACRFGKQVGAAGREFAELGHRGVGFLLGRLTPASVPPDDAVQLGHEQPVRLRAQMILNHLAIIERTYDKRKMLGSFRTDQPGRNRTCRP
jgi:hypothetical protein